MKQLTDKRLIRVGKAGHDLIVHWKEGVSLERDSAASIEELCRRVATARLVLARDQRRDGNAALKRRPPLLRTAVSRFYYSMYHSVRAAAYLFHGGDDHEAHSNLPLHVPDDFPNRSVWQNTLKSAREHRNRADYDPYPQSVRSWLPVAAQLSTECKALYSETRAYLASKGCRIR